MAELLVLEGSAADALDSAERTLERSPAFDGIFPLGPTLHRMRGLALLQLGRFDEARAALDESLEGARKAGADYEVALALDALAALGAARGREPGDGRAGAGRDLRAPRGGRHSRVPAPARQARVLESVSLSRRGTPRPTDTADRSVDDLVGLVLVPLEDARPDGQPRVQVDVVAVREQAPVERGAEVGVVDRRGRRPVLRRPRRRPALRGSPRRGRCRSEPRPDSPPA